MGTDRAAQANEVSARILKTLRETGRPTEYKSGATIFAEGEPGNSLLVIDRGMARIVRYSGSGRLSILAFTGAGQIIGEIACLGRLARTATVECVTDLSGHLVSRAAVDELLEKDASVSRAFLELLCRRLEATDATAHRAGAQNMRSRLAGAILMLAVEHGQEDEAGTWLSLPLTRSEIGAFAGLSRENVSRVLAEWRRKRLLNYSDNEKELLIMDRDALETIFYDE